MLNHAAILHYHLTILNKDPNIKLADFFSEEYIVVAILIQIFEYVFKKDDPGIHSQKEEEKEELDDKNDKLS